MQNLLFVDRLKNIKYCRNFYEKIYNMAYEIAKDAIVATNPETKVFSLDLNPAIAKWKPRIDKLSKEEKMLFSTVISAIHRDKDDGMFNYLTAMTLYQQKNAKNYVFTQGLAEILAKTSADIPAKYFPKEFSGYFEIPGLKDLDDVLFTGVFVNISGNAIQLVGAMKQEGYPITYLQLDMDRNKTFREIIENSDGFIRERDGEETNEGKSYYSFQHTIGNALAFVCNSEFELEQEYNEFSNKAKKALGQQRCYTQLPFVVVGKDYHGRKYHISESITSGHWKWQPYGSKFSKIKLIYIKPYTRKFNNKEQLCL